VEGRLARVDTGSVELACLTDGPTDGPLALLVHGFPDGPQSFRHQVAPLVARGFRVVRPATRGYAPSSLARDGRYDVERLARDLLALGEHFSPARPFALVGHDWGAIAAYAAAALAPERLRRLCTLAVPHLRVAGPRWRSPSQLWRSRYMALFQLRGLAERRVAARDFAFIDGLWRAWSPGYTATREELDAIKDGFRAPAHLAAVLGYYRALPSLVGARLLGRRTRVPSLYLHGADDGCIGVALVDGVERAYCDEIEVVRVTGAGHFLQLERPDEISARIADFLV
jgi:pimeloyl-ACP methyl ester carboxylesterase